MTQPGTATGSTTPSTTPPAPAEAAHPISEPTAPLWFGDRSGQRYPGATAPTPPSWAGSGPAVPPTTPSSQSSGARRVWPAVLTASLLSAALASGGTYATVRAADGNVTSPSTSSSAASPAGSSASAGAQEIRQVNPNAPDWTATAAAVTPSVVAISLQVQGGAAQGSGVVIDSSGHILTNNHVVDGAVEGTIEVTLADGRKYSATVAGTDPSTDLAVITVKNPPSDLKAIALGDSNALKVGDPVMAVGNPLGLASTVTTGIVSALNRPVTTGDSQTQFGQQAEPVYTNAIQTSAAINPGNSGGALVDADGRLIGINSSIASTGSNSGNIGIGFAIPVVEAQAIAKQLIANGKAQHAFLGVTLRDGEASDGAATRAGAEVQQVSPDTPAQAAGLQAGDVVVAVDGTPVESRDSLIAKIRAEQVGSTVQLTIIRGGARQEVSVTLAVRPTSGG